MQNSKYSKLIHSVLFWIIGGGTLFFPLFVFPKIGDSVNLPKTFFLFIWVSIILLLWSTNALIEKKLILRRSMLDIPLVLLITGLVLSSLLSLSQGTSFLGSTENFTLTVLTFFPALAFTFLLLQLIRSPRSLEYLLQMLCFSSVLTLVFYHLSYFSVFRLSVIFPLFGETFFQTISSANSIFGIWVAAMGILSFGLLLLKRREKFSSSISAVSAILCTFTLFRLGFDVAFIVFAIGLALLLVLPFVFIKFIRVPMALVTFFIFLITVFSLIFGSPSFLKGNFPVEIALGNVASLDIVKGVLLTDIKQFLFGSGPGTFMYDFSLHRTPAFNTNAIVSETRFHFPFSTFYALLSELGVMGTLFFVLLILIGGGALVSAWVELRQSSDESEHQAFAQMFDVFVVGASWLALTFGLFVSFVDITVWWTWWCLLGCMIAGIGFVNKKFVVEQSVNLSVSPQYSLALSFGILFFFTLLLLSTAFGTRLFFAEYFFEKGSHLASIDDSERYVERAIDYRKSYAPYHISLARIYLQKAKNEYEKQKNASDKVAEYIAKGGNEAHLASKIDPKNVETWETLALLYLNAGSFVPEANVWAKDALKSAIVLEPSNAVNHFRMGGILASEGNFNDAQKEYSQAIQLKFDYVPAYMALITLYREQNKFNEAIMLFEPLLRLDRTNVDIVFQYGMMFFNRQAEGDNARAEQVWLETLKLSPNHSNTLYSLGLLYERVGDTNRAFSYYQKVKELNPANVDVKKKLQGMVK